MSQLTVIDFFCGAGGFSEGFRQMGCKIIYGYDHWKPAVETFNYNYNLKCEVKNILDFQNSSEEIESLPDTDIIVGSPPCVSFSSSNRSGKADKSLGLDLTRCFLRVVAIKKHKPASTLKAWYMENVANSIKYINQIYTFEDLELENWAIENGLNPKNEALNLRDNTFIINSANYGSYQARKRAISGELINLNKFKLPKQTHFETPKNNGKPWNTLGKFLNAMPSPFLKESNKLFIDPIYPKLEVHLTELTDHFYDSGLYESEWKQSKELKTNHYCMGKMAFPENIHKPSRTITATKSGTSREALIYKTEIDRNGNGEYRSPTIREAASLMGFPFSYQFIGAINAKWRLVGNAVCPSVSRVLAAEVLNEYKIKKPIELNVYPISNLVESNNINDFELKAFNKQPQRTQNSKFRRHPIKEGNLTVTLSNYEIETKAVPNKKWFTSIQYGTGINYKHQKVKDGVFKEIEHLILKQEGGKEFVKIINNGFSEKIGTSFDLQQMYEEQRANSDLLEPTDLVHEIGRILNQIIPENKVIILNESKVFKHKNQIPLKQLFALYAVNKITTIANQK